MGFRPSRLERTRRRIVEVCDFVESLTNLGDAVTKCVKAWRRAVLVTTGSVVSVTAACHWRDLVHFVLR
jgi:hypothetical protein